MKRRLGITALFLLVLLGGVPAASAGILGNAAPSSPYWGCIVIDDLDFGFCLKNPLPDRLPLPS